MARPSLDDIKERKIVQWGLAYLGVAWLILQVVVALGGVYGWPGWLLRTVPVLLIAGFLAALVIAWYHGEQGRQRVGGVELGILAALFGLAGLGVAFVGPGEDASQAASESHLVETEDLDNLEPDRALELAYDWGTSGNVEAATEVLDYLIQRSDSDSARMSLLALGASLLSRNDRPDDATTWIGRLMDVDPVALTLSSEAGPEITRGYLDAMRKHYSAQTRPSTVRSIAVLPQNTYVVGFPDSLSQLRRDVGRAVPDLLSVELTRAVPSSIAVVERKGVPISKDALPIGTVSVGLPGSDWLWIDEGLMPTSWIQASHYVLSYCTYLGEPFDADGMASLTCNARLLSAEGAGIRASAQSRGDVADLMDMVEEMSLDLADQLVQNPASSSSTRGSASGT